MNRALLEKPFPVEAIKTRKGAFGHDLSYVEAAMYIRRLNDAFDGCWSWKIIDHRERGAEVIVHGVLEAGGVAKHAFGGSSITVHKGTNDVISLADDLKSASTDALKKACSMLGIGLDLYSTSASAGSEPVPKLRSLPSASTALTTERAGPQDRNRITAKQLRAIFAIAHSQSTSEADLKRRCQDTYGVMPEYLTRQDASSLIDAMSTR